MPTADRRRHPRQHMAQPIRGAVGESRVYVIDASVCGVRVAHQASLPPPGGFCRIEVMTDLGPIRLDCQVVRTVSAQSLYHTGLQIVSADHQSVERLRSICAARESTRK